MAVGRPAGKGDRGVRRHRRAEVAMTAAAAAFGAWTIILIPAVDPVGI
jgi:hypothetical protein